MLFWRFEANFWQLLRPTPAISDQSKTANVKPLLPSPSPCPAPLPRKVLTSHKSHIASTSTMKSTPEGIRIQLHLGKPKKTPPSPIILKTTIDKEKLKRWHSRIHKRRKEPFALSPHARQTLSVPQAKLLSLEKHDNAIVFNPIDFPPDYPKDFEDEDHSGHDSPLFH